MDTGTAQPADRSASEAPVTLQAALSTLRDQAGRTLGEHCDEQPMLACLLRHNGCTFCRETIAEVGKARPAIERAGLGIGVVGMSPSVAPLITLGQRFGLSGVAWFADPDRLLYRSLSVGRGSFMQLLGPRVLWAGVRGVLRGYGLGRPEGDPFQMPGTAVIHRGRVLRRYVHRLASDRPDYTAFACQMDA